MVQITVAALLLAAAVAPVIATPIEAREPRKTKVSGHRIGHAATAVGAFAGTSVLCILIILYYLC